MLPPFLPPPRVLPPPSHPTPPGGTGGGASVWQVLLISCVLPTPLNSVVACFAPRKNFWDPIYYEI